MTHLTRCFLVTSAIDVIDAYHETDHTNQSDQSDQTDQKDQTDQTTPTDPDHATISAPQQLSSNSCPITLIPPLRPVSNHPTLVSHQGPPSEPDHPVFVTNTSPLQLPGFPPNGCVPVTRSQQPCPETGTSDGQQTAIGHRTDTTRSAGRWTLVSPDGAASTSAERASPDATGRTKCPASAAPRSEQRWVHVHLHTSVALPHIAISKATLIW